jgi:hypothetical protein
MSCGTKIEGRFHSYYERQDLADALDREGEYRLADKVKRQECLDDGELRRAERSLDSRGLSKHFDYREERCACRSDEGDGY